ncbi:MAG TPA: hypothetical protein VMW86_10810 [Dehalococcoidales bacterium]|nr:hypothetical protein [Dehalococcoidales bacterium]
MIKIIPAFLVILVLFLIGCSERYPEYQEKVTLATGGYGYEVGDIVIIDTQKTPEVGDIVQYDWALNKSNCFGMGPALYLAKIIGLPGGEVIFSRCDFKINGYIGTSPCGEGISPNTKMVIWGSDTYEDVAGRQLIVPSNEYLADKWVGQECTGEVDETGSSKVYNRFTVKNEAIKGVILIKLGHDKEFEESQKNIVY